MKFSQVVLFAALAAGLASGCSRRPKNITPLPASERVGGGITSLNPVSRPLPGVISDGGTGPGRVSPLPGDPTSSGRDLTPPTPPTDIGAGLKPFDSAQVDRSKWETWPQDPDTLRRNIVYFDFDKSVVKRGESAKVAEIAEWLKGHPGYMLKLDGHADERGTEDYNRALGERRALGVREMLLNLGVSQDSVVTGTYGEDRPAELGHNEAAWSKNRRVEPIVLIPPGSAR